MPWEAARDRWLTQQPYEDEKECVWCGCLPTEPTKGCEDDCHEKMERDDG